MPRQFKFTEYHVPIDFCPHCDRRLDCASVISREEGPQYGPRPGDVTVCIVCATILIFTDQLHLRKATQRDLVELAKQTEQFLLVLECVRAVKAIKGNLYG